MERHKDGHYHTDAQTGVWMGMVSDKDSEQKHRQTEKTDGQLDRKIRSQAVEHLPNIFIILRPKCLRNF